MSSTKPTIVIIPGSFSAYGTYDPFLALIRNEGFTALAVKLPSTQKRHPLPPATLQDDAAHVRSVVEQITAEGDGTEVVILAHSYGGTVATEALAGLGLTGEKKGGIKRLVFLSAIAPKVGETQLTAMRLEGGLLPEDVGGYMHMDAAVMAPFVANDLPYAQAYENALQLSHHSAISFHNEVTQASYKDIPSTYIFCENDLVVSPDRQQRFIETIEEVSGKKVDVKKIDAGHIPLWSKPEETLKLLIDATLQ